MPTIKSNTIPQFDFKNIYTGFKTVQRLPRKAEKFYLLYGKRGEQAQWLECSEDQYKAFKASRR